MSIKSNRSFYTIVWSFQVKQNCIEAFEKAYGPSGDWAQLFGQAEGYCQTMLYHDVAKPGHYLVMDRWVSKAAYQQFLQTYQDAYQQLDTVCEVYTLQETCWGELNVLCIGEDDS